MVCQCCPEGVLTRALAATKPFPSKGDQELPITVDSDSDDTGGIEGTSEHEHVDAAQSDEHAVAVNSSKSTAAEKPLSARTFLIFTLIL